MSTGTNNNFIEADVTSDDFYLILGLTKAATDEDIKKAYKKQAIRWHPDKHQAKSEEERKKAEEIFKKVGEAYETLSDKNKRAIYDRYGKEGLQAGAGGGSGASTGGSYFRGSGFNGGGFTFQHAEDIFRNFFNGRDPFADFFDDDDMHFGAFGGPFMKKQTSG